jgi:hypothetical protein
MGTQRETQPRAPAKHKINTKDIRKRQRHELGSDKKQRLNLNSIETYVVITAYVIGKKSIIRGGKNLHESISLQ